MNNFVQMNLPGKIDNLEQQLNQLNGQLEEKTHTIEQLQRWIDLEEWDLI